MKLKTIILKISGASLQGDQTSSSYDVPFLHQLAHDLNKLINENENLKFIIVLGGGNLLRGAEISAKFDSMKLDDLKLPSEIDFNYKIPLDFAGMVGTVANGLVFGAILQRFGIDNKIFSFLPLEGHTTIYTQEKLDNALLTNDIVLVSGGIGKPNFTTDILCFFLADEHHATKIMFGKNNVDGVYDGDPALNPDAKFIPEISFQEISDQNLEIFAPAATAAALKLKNKLEVQVFDMQLPGVINDVFLGEGKHTKITG